MQELGRYNHKGKSSWTIGHHTCFGRSRSEALCTWQVIEGVSNVPDYEEFELDEKTLYLIVASDGLWDVCEDQQAIELCKECQNSKEMAKTLLSHALSNGTRDNTSILVLKF